MICKTLHPVFKHRQLAHNASQKSQKGSSF
jgi:hypothetical protein